VTKVSFLFLDTGWTSFPETFNGSTFTRHWDLDSLILVQHPYRHSIFSWISSSIPGSHMAFSQHASIVSSGPWQSQTYLLLVTLTIGRSTSQTFIECSSTWIFYCFLMIRLVLWALRKNIGEVPLSHHISQYLTFTWFYLFLDSLAMLPWLMSNFWAQAILMLQSPKMLGLQLYTTIPGYTTLLVMLIFIHWVQVLTARFLYCSLYFSFR
jgi:hypothetical protein